VGWRSSFDDGTATYLVSYTGDSAFFDQSVSVPRDDFPLAMLRAIVFMAN
jgi:hypothetical protein